MNWRDSIVTIGRNLAALGARRLAVLGGAGLLVFAVVAYGSYLASKPSMVMLYSGLDRHDINTIGNELANAGIPFDVNDGGTAVFVPPSRTANARMLLAEKGLPRSTNAGYELFDNLGSLGLTSFMQEVTLVRALEGEIARTIQTLNGVKAARVHIVFPRERRFSRDGGDPTASVVLRTGAGVEAGSARAIRHLVAAAVPGLELDHVTVIDTNGALLAAGGEAKNASPGNLVGLEQTVERRVRDNIQVALAPHLGVDNFQISVSARLNTDRRQVKETTFDPESRVERSVRVVKENDVTRNVTASGTVSVEENLPEEESGASSGNQTNETNERREELTNYELSSKTTSTTSDGYAVERLSIAVVVNRRKVAEALGEQATPQQVEERLKELEQIVASSAGFREDRGDQLKVSALDFVQTELTAAPDTGFGILATLNDQAGTLVRSLTFVVVTLMVLMLGLKPVTRAVLDAGPAPPRQLAEGGPVPELADNSATGADGAKPNLVADLTGDPARTPQKRLEQIVDLDEGKAASILKQLAQEA